VDTGYFKPSDARRLASKILIKNAVQFFGQGEGPGDGS